MWHGQKPQRKSWCELHSGSPFLVVILALFQMVIEHRFVVFFAIMPLLLQSNNTSLSVLQILIRAIATLSRL